LAFIVFRIINVFLIQSQFDPDEFWQNLEPSYCHVFGDYDPASSSSCPGLTWEWKRRQIQQDQDTMNSIIPFDTTIKQNWSHSIMDYFTFALEGPVRSFSSIVPTLLFYIVIKKYKWDSSWMVSRGPVFINAIFVTAVTDWTIWYMSRWIKPITTTKQHQLQKEDSNKGNDITFWCVYCSITSWFNAYTLIRTYSNSLETVLLALSLALVSPVFLSTNQTPKNSSSTATATTRA